LFRRVYKMKVLHKIEMIERRLGSDKARPEVSTQHDCGPQGSNRRVRLVKGLKVS